MLLALALFSLPVTGARAQPRVSVGGACPDTIEGTLRELVALETSAPVDVDVRCDPARIRISLTHRQSGGQRTIEAPPDTGAEALRNVALLVAEAAALAAADAPPPPPDDPEEPDDPEPPAVADPGPSWRNFVGVAVGGAVDGRPEARLGAEIGGRLGTRIGLRVLARLLVGPEPGDAIASVWIPSLGLGPGLTLGDGFVRWDLSLLGYLGAAIAAPGQATSMSSSLWFAGGFRGGVVLGRGTVAVALLAEVGLQRRLDRRVVDEAGMLIEEAEGSIFLGALWLELRLRQSTEAPRAQP